MEEIDRLNKENEALRSENREIKERNQQLSSRVNETARQNEVLTERMTLAEKLNVTGLALQPLNKKGKNEKKGNKGHPAAHNIHNSAEQLDPRGRKNHIRPHNIAFRPTFRRGGSFDFEGGSVPCSAKKTIEYEGEEIAGVTIFWDVNTPLIAGDYTVELFADNFRLVSRSFNLK